MFKQIPGPNLLKKFPWYTKVNYKALKNLQFQFKTLKSSNWSLTVLSSVGLQVLVFLSTKTFDKKTKLNFLFALYWHMLTIAISIKAYQIIALH